MHAVPKLRELRGIVNAANSWDEVEIAQTRVLGYLRSSSPKEMLKDFEDIGPGGSFGGADAARVAKWKAKLLAYMDGLIDASGIGPDRR